MKHTEIKSVSILSPLDQLEDEQIFCVQISAEIGVKGEIGADLFYLKVCSPKWLERRLAEPTSGYGMLIMKDFDLRLVECWIRRVCKISFDGDWNQAVEVISKYMMWEYSDYRAKE